MGNEGILGQPDFNVDHAIKMIKAGGFKEIYTVIFDALKETLEKYKELKQFNLPIVAEQTSNASAPFFEAQMDFNEFLGAINIRSVQSKRFSEREVQMIQLFINKYLNDPQFPLKIVDFGRKFVQQSKEKNVISPMQTENIVRYFELFPETLLEVKVLLESLLSDVDIDVNFVYHADEKERILEALRNKVDRENLSVKNKQLLRDKLKQEVEAFGFSRHITTNEIEANFINWFDNVYKKSFVNMDRINEITSSMKPLPNFSYEVITYTGPLKWLVNFLREIFGMPVAKLKLSAYEGTKFKNSLFDESKVNKYEENPALEMFRLSNDITKILKSAEEVMDILGISEQVLKEHSIEKINIYQNYLFNKFELCDFVMQLFTEIKRIGIAMGKIKIKYFITFMIKTLSKFKTSVNTPLNNYFQMRVSEIAEDNQDTLRKALHDMNVELSGFFVNLSRLEDMEVKNTTQKN